MRKEKGFSMLETIIVSGVVMVASAAAVPSIVKASRQYQLKAVAQQINQALQSAKFEAIRMNASKTVSFNLSTNQMTLSNGTVVQLPSGVSFSSLPEEVYAPQSVLTATVNGVTGQPTNSKLSCSFPSSTGSTNIKLATFNSRGIPSVQPGAYNWVNLKNTANERIIITLSSAGSTRTLSLSSDAHWKGTTDSGSIDDTYLVNTVINALGNVVTGS